MARVAGAARAVPQQAAQLRSALAGVSRQHLAGAFLALLLAALLAYIKSTAYGTFHADLGPVYHLWDYQFDAFLERTPGTVVVNAFVPGMSASQASMYFASAPKHLLTYEAREGKSDEPLTFAKINMQDAMRARINLLGEGLFDTHQINQAMGGSDYKMFVFTDVDPDWVGPPEAAPRRKTSLLTKFRSYFSCLGLPRALGGKYVKPLYSNIHWEDVVPAAVRAHRPRYDRVDVSELQDLVRDSNDPVAAMFVDPDAPDGSMGYKQLLRSFADKYHDTQFYLVEENLVATADAFDISEPTFALILSEVLRNPHEQTYRLLSLSEDVDQDKMSEHYMSSMHPLVARIQRTNQGKMMGRTRPVGPYIREVQIFSRSAMGPDDHNPDLTNEGFAEIVQMLSPLAAKYNQHLFHVFPMDERTMKAPREHYNFDETEEFRGDDKWSELRVGITYHGIRPPPTTDSRFTMRKPVTAESLATFIEEVEEGGRHQAKYKSQDIPPLAEAGRTQVVVCDSFKEQVIESKKDVFVLFHTIYDKQSFKAMAVWERMAAKRLPGVVFATFDIRENDYPDEALKAHGLIAAYDLETMSPETGDIGKAIPAMVYFKKRAKNEPALYSGPQNDEEIEEFTKGALANPAKQLSS